jgi:leucyl-tRNA synthetase
MKMNNYDHKKIEGKWQKEWEKNGIYKTQDSSLKSKYYILDMFPYPSGEGLHVGHPKGYIATDIISRMKRMQGMNVLHPMGFDAFGLPAENYAIKMKVNPADAVKKNVARFKKQLEIIGLDYDWSREVNTTDPKFYKWTQWIFLKLFEKGLAYESYEPINWCPSCKTGLANEDLEDGKCERCGSEIEQKPMRQWVLKITDYAERLLQDLDQLDWPESIKESQRNWIGKSEGSEIEFQLIASGRKLDAVSVFTTRADTLFGATYMVLALEHKLVEELKEQVENWNEVQTYIKKVKNKTNIERTAEGKEKTGVELKGIKAINPANGEEIPVWIADYVLASYGTGAVMAVPAHDERDFEFAKKYNLEIKQTIMSLENDSINPPKEGLEEVKRDTVIVFLKNNETGKYALLDWHESLEGITTGIMGGIEKGQTSEEAVLAEIKEEASIEQVIITKELRWITGARYCASHKNQNRCAVAYVYLAEVDNLKNQGIIAEDEKKKHTLIWVNNEDVFKKLTPDHQKFIWTQLFNESALTDDGILINSGQFDDLTSEEARKKITEFVGGKIVTKYKLRDWVFSRQRYWGEPIPILHDGDKVIPVSEKDLPVILPKVKSYEPTGTGESPLATIDKWVNQKGGMKRETNTMPQWAGSSWYYLRYMDPNNDEALVDKKKEKYWNQIDFYVGGAEHATRHLIYARFWHKFLYDIGTVSTIEPFKKLQSVGLIIGEDGRKMSKRFGNIVNPDEIIKNYGADTLRIYEMFMGPFDQAASWSTQAIIGPRRFLDKIWRIANEVIEKDIKETNIGLEKTLHKTIKKVGEDIESMNFNTAVSSMMMLVNEMDREVISKEDFKKFLKILSPFAPHIAEELWQKLRINNEELKIKNSTPKTKHQKPNTSIHLSEWPKWDKKKIIEEEVKIAVQVNGKVRAEIMVSKDMTEEDIKKIALQNKNIFAWTDNREVKKVIYVPGRVINIVI